MLERGRTALGTQVTGGGRRFLPRPFVTSCLELLGFSGLLVEDPRPCLIPDPQVRDGVRARLERMGLAPGEPYLLANVGGRSGSSKSYPTDSWARALDLIAAWTTLPVVLVYGPGEEDGAEAVRERAESLPRLFGPPAADLRELVALAAGSSLVLTADGGPRHIAAATGRPIVCVFGPTDPRHTAAGLERTKSVSAPTDCAPCHLERCPLHGEDHKRCMLEVRPEELAQATEELLRAQGA